MKYSAAVATAILATGALAKPSFTNNSAVNPEEGKPLTLTVNGCEGGCTITLESGPDSGHLTTFKTLSSDTTTSYTVTLTGIASGNYAFKVTNNADKTTNYSNLFSYAGTGPTSASSTSASATSSSSSASSTGSSTATTTTTASSSATTSASSTKSTTNSTSSSSESATSSTQKSTSSTKPSSTSPPNSAAALTGFSTLALVGAAAAALFL